MITIVSKPDQIWPITSPPPYPLDPVLAQSRFDLLILNITLSFFNKQF